MQKSSKQSSDFLLFEQFIDYLKQQGFVIGVDTHVRIKALMNKLDAPLSGDRLKYLLCPLLAHDLEQQAIFYQSYDYFFGNNGLKNQALAPKQKASPPPALKLVTPKRPSRLFYLLTTFLLVIGLSLTGLYYLNSSPSSDDSLMLNDDFDWDNDFLGRGDTTDVSIENFLNISADSPEDYAPVEASLDAGEQEVTLTDWFQKYLPYLKWLLIGLLVLAWLLYEWYRYQRRKLLLHQQYLQQQPTQLRPILLHTNHKIPHNEQELHQSATMMRRRQQSEATVLDIPQTIKATIAASGYPSFRYKAGSRTSEYLVLIDQAAEDDHLAAMFHQLMDELAHLDIFLDTYYYENDPRICWKTRDGDQFYLESLYYKHPHHRLLLIGDAQCFVDTLTDTLPEWFEIVELWKDKAILSTRPTDQWDECEFTLSKHINLLPAILPSIALLIEQFEQEAAPNLTMWIAKNYLLLQPSLEYAFKEAPNLRQTPYTSEQVHEQCEQVRDYLGEDVYQWLCACSVYPELKWHLTLSLGQLLDKDGTLMQPNKLLRLARLDWFRTGKLPEITRSYLAGQLNQENEAIVSNHFTSYLEKTAATQDQLNSSQLSQFAVLHPIRKAGNFLKNLILRRELPDPLQKGTAYVSMQSVETVKRWMFGLQLPKFIQKLFYRRGLPLLGMRTGVRATGVLLSIAFLIWLMQPPEVSEAEVKQAVNQGVEAFMNNQYDQSFDILYNYHESEHFDPYAKYLLGEILFHGLGYQDKDLDLAGQFFNDAAELGVAEAMIYKGFFHSNGIGNNKNPEIADAWFEKGRKKLLEPENMQRTTGLYMLGLTSKTGYGTSTDYAEALEWFKKAGYENYGPAQNEAGLMYQYGRGTDKSGADAFKWFGQSAQTGFAPGQNNLAWCYHQGIGVDKDYKKAIKWYVKALKQGYTESQRELDYLFDRVLELDGYGPETVKWYKEVAEQGYAPAQNSIGYIYDNGIGVREDDQEAFQWYQKAAAQGYIMAQNNLGYMYRNGLGTEKAPEQAYRWYHAAAEQGYPPAQNNLGFLLDQGIGVKENDKEAFQWYQKAATQGHADACYNVGMMYRYGMGTPMDKTLAFMWYSRAADQGNAMSQYELGFMYEKGVGTDMNYTRAREWYVYAAIQGHQKAKDALERLNMTFFDDELELDIDKLNKFQKDSNLGL